MNLDLTNKDGHPIDGGGGGGGASVLRETVDQPYVVAGGGGGGSALSNHSLLQTIAIEYNYSSEASGPGVTINFTSDLVSLMDTAGVGAGYYSNGYSTTRFSGNDLSLTSPSSPDGGEEICHKSMQDITTPSQGGYGGGGAGCEAGGGRGGYDGGAVGDFLYYEDLVSLNQLLYIPGQGGSSYALKDKIVLNNIIDYADSELPLNEGDGYVMLVPSDCDCTGSCILYENGTFECTCPNNTYLASDEFDCFQCEYILLKLKIFLIRTVIVTLNLCYFFVMQ